MLFAIEKYNNETKFQKQPILQQQIKQNVEIYMRLTNSKSIKSIFPSRVNSNLIKQKIAQKLNIPKDDQLILYKGQQIGDNISLQLTNKSIIHVINKKQKANLITIHLIKHFYNKKSLSTEVESEANAITNHSILDFLNKELSDLKHLYEINQTRVIESGRFLQLTKTFSDQRIQNNTQIHLILRQKQIASQKSTDKEEENMNNIMKMVLKRSRENSKIQECKQNDTNMEERQKAQIQPLALRQQNNTAQLKGLSSFRQNLGNYETIKSGMINSTKKNSKEIIIPLRFSLTNPIKNVGPKSKRQCKCDRKKVKQHLKTQPCTTDRKIESMKLINKGKLKTKNTLK